MNIKAEQAQNKSPTSRICTSYASRFKNDHHPPRPSSMDTTLLSIALIILIIMPSRAVLMARLIFFAPSPQRSAIFAVVVVRGAVALAISPRLGSQTRRGLLQSRNFGCGRRTGSHFGGRGRPRGWSGEINGWRE